MRIYSLWLAVPIILAPGENPQHKAPTDIDELFAALKRLNHQHAEISQVLRWSNIPGLRSGGNQRLMGG